MAIVFEGFGNVLTHEAQTITCPVNTVAVMGAGLALAMRNRVRGVNDFYKGKCSTGDLAVGRPCTFVMSDQEDKQVLLFPTKGHWKDDSRLEDVEEGLKYLAAHYKELGIKELAMVPLGCGLGKLDYIKDVRPLIMEHLDDIDLPVYLLLRDTA